MFACIFFLEDGSLSVVHENDKNLEKLGNFQPRESVKMKWNKKIYTGTIIKISENEGSLDHYAKTAYTAILKGKEITPGDIYENTLDELLHYKQCVNKSGGKRDRVQTTKLKESQEQDKEFSPKKKKKISEVEKENGNSDSLRLSNTTTKRKKTCVKSKNVSEINNTPASKKKEDNISKTKTSLETEKNMLPLYKQFFEGTNQTEQDSTSTKQDSTSTKQDSTSTKQDSTCTKQGSTSTKQDSTSTKQDSTSTKQDSTRTKQDSTSTKQGSTCTKQISNSTKQDSTCTKQDSTCTKQDSTSTKQGSTCTKQDSTCTKQGSTSTKQDSTSTKQGSTFTKQDSTCTKQDSTSTKQDSTSARQDSTSARQDSTSARQDSTSARQDSTSDKESNNNQDTFINPETDQLSGTNVWTPPSLTAFRRIYTQSMQVLDSNPHNPSINAEMQQGIGRDMMVNLRTFVTLIGNLDFLNFLRALVNHFEEDDCVHPCVQKIQGLVPQIENESGACGGGFLDDLLSSPNYETLNPMCTQASQEEGIKQNKSSNERDLPHGAQRSLFQSQQGMSTASEPSSSSEMRNMSSEPGISSSLRRSPRKLSQTSTAANQSTSRNSNHQRERTTVTACVRKSPKKKQNKADEMVKLFKDSCISIGRRRLVKADSAAQNRKGKEGYYLMYRLMGDVFTVEEMAESRGQGIGKAKLGEDRPVLDPARIKDLKDYVRQWCVSKKLAPPEDSILNLAITGRVGYARKQHEKKFMLNDDDEA